MKTLIVYTKPGCVHCAQAKDYLKGLEIPFTEVDIVANPDAREKLIAAGHKTMPAIYVDDVELVPGGNSALRTMRKDEILERLQ